MIPETLEVHSNWWIYLYTMQIVFQASMLTQIVNENEYRSCDKISRDDWLLSEPTTMVNGNDL